MGVVLVDSSCKVGEKVGEYDGIAPSTNGSWVGVLEESIGTGK